MYIQSNHWLDDDSPNSIVSQIQGAQGKEEAGSWRKVEPIGTPTLGADAPTVSTRSGVSDAGNRKNMDDGVGFYTTEWVEGAREQSYSITIGMEEATERRTNLWRGKMKDLVL